MTYQGMVDLKQRMAAVDGLCSMIDSYAYMDGYRIVSFSKPNEAEQWLLGELK